MISQDERLGQRVGLWALAALVLVIGFFMFVYGRVHLGSRIHVHVYFHEVGPLHEAAPLVIAGRAIGGVEAIALAPKAAPLHGDDGVAVAVWIDAREAARIDPSGDVFQASKGPLADRYLEIGPGSGAPGGLHDGEDLVGRDPPSLDQVMSRTWKQLQELGAFVDEVRPDFDALVAQAAEVRARFDPAAAQALPNAAEIAPFRADVDAIGSAADSLRAALGGDARIAEAAEVAARAGALLAQSRAALHALDESADRLRANLDALRARLDASGQGVIAQVELTIDRVRADSGKLDAMLATVDEIRQSYARGEGTAWKIANDPEFAADAKELGKVIKRHPWRVLEHPIRDR